MRELKFRAWHHGGGDPRVEGDMRYSHPFPILFWENVHNEVLAVEVMQYTGLKDRNGTEIYEGDRIEIEVDGGEGDINHGTGIVVFENGCFCVDSFLFFTFHEIMNFGKVIGNIHQNPELLEPK
jgi:uncharacterized phage protein (TIGR01671 family)